MNGSRSLIWTGLLLFGASLNAQFDRCGGEGPKPFADSHGIGPIQWIPTVAKLGEFALLQESEDIIYRNEENAFYRFTGIKHVALNSEGLPPLTLSPVIHPTGKYILATDRQNFSQWVLNPDSSWVSFFKPRKRLHPLFWRENSLFLYHWEEQQGDRILEVFTYDPNEKTLKERCRHTFHGASNLFLAEGHLFPHLFLYSLHEKKKGYQVTLGRFNVNACIYFNEGFFENHTIPAPVKQVYRYYPLDALAIWVDLRGRELIWKDPKRCQYFKLDGQAPVFLAPQTPSILIWNRSRGVQYVNFIHDTKSKILAGLPLAQFDPTAAFLTRDLETLYFGPVFAGENNPRILRVSVSIKGENNVH